MRIKAQKLEEELGSQNINLRVADALSTHPLFANQGYTLSQLRTLSGNGLKRTR